MRKIVNFSFVGDNKFVVTTKRVEDGSKKGIYYKYTHNYREQTLTIERVVESVGNTEKVDVTDKTPTNIFVEIAGEVMTLFAKHIND